MGGNQPAHRYNYSTRFQTSGTQHFKKTSVLAGNAGLYMVQSGTTPKREHHDISSHPRYGSVYDRCCVFDRRAGCTQNTRPIRRDSAEGSKHCGKHHTKQTGMTKSVNHDRTHDDVLLL